MKKLLILSVLLCFLAGCGAKTVVPPTTVVPEKPSGIVGICLPDEQDPYWQACGVYLQRELDALGLEHTLYYSKKDVLLQAAQLKELYQQNVSCLVVACIDSVGLEDALSDYHTAGIPVVALDRPLLDTQAVQAWITFDYQAMGEAMGRHIENQLRLTDAQQDGRSYTVEFFMGSPDDPNALSLHQGIFSVLQNYLNTGVLTCPSGRTSFEDTWVLREDGEKAAEMLQRYISQYYPEDTYPQIICTADNPLAQGCQEVLQTLNCPADRWPMITGLGYEGADGISQKQSLTVNRDLQQLSVRCVAAVRMLLTDGQLAADFANDTFNNHVRSVPVCNCDFRLWIPSQEQTGEETKEQLPTEES